MRESFCCGKEMYQEITLDNMLLSICRVCGKTVKQKVSFAGKGKDDIEIFNIKGVKEE